MVAYEPMWAIGAQAEHAAAPEWIEAIHLRIADRLNAMFGIEPRIPVMHGGSVDDQNAREILRRAGVDGLLVGRHALDPAGFARIAHP